ncbi:cytochrome c-type biogenesis protein CcmH [Litorimonas sp. RW-G-Af-16]|uniref:cytochrome c-type biogenesis protein n=1 Tax=Litorimonas sp. RW-G-Af-16 TaxID=3241168 RepID=UPI00390CD6A3
MKYLIIAFFLFTAPAFAQDSDLETRAKDVGHALRCVVCQNQSIEESDALLAADMRKLVRERLSAGDSEAEVIDYMQERYGDYVLLKPPVQGNTYALWFLPFLVMVGGLIWFMVSGKRRAS